MEIKAKCTFNDASIRALAHALTYQRKSPRKCLMALCACGAAVFLALALSGAASQNKLLLVIPATLVSVSCFLYFGFPKLMYRSWRHLQNMENEYTFTEDGFAVLTKNEEYRGESECQYSMISKVMESSRYFFVFCSKQAFVVEKATVTNGTVDELGKKLKSYAKNRHIVCGF